MVTIPKFLCYGYSEAIIICIESVEQGYYKACTGVICKKLNELFSFLSLYEVYG